MFGAEPRGLTGHRRVSCTHILPQTAYFKRPCLILWLTVRGAFLSELEDTQKMVLQGHELQTKRYRLQRFVLSSVTENLL